ncbi:MAG: outer membrane beta-barrel protein [Dissulfurimicrobium sp.]|uniref:outer membrane beta-barrel protein n=1 Tax=Dissulfurimicrobium sp. TaxID=2022436 RepID=UPI003D14C803
MGRNLNLFRHGFGGEGAWIFITAILFLLTFLPAGIVCADTEDKEIRKELEELRAKVKDLDALKTRVQELEERLAAKDAGEGQETVKEELREKEGAAEKEGEKKKIVKLVSPYLDNLNITGGVSGGWFSTTNEGPGNKSSNFVLSNLLLDLSSEMEGGLLGFNVGLGGVTTPSVFDAPNDTTPDFRIEYASINLKPIRSLEGLSVETGLLKPNSGYESTYTFQNPNVTVGALASQQPYNAMGARVTYAFGEDLKLWGAMFKHRLDDDEYRTDDVYLNEYGEPRGLGAQDSSSWEVGVNGSVNGLGLSLYHYHLNDLRHLTGIVIDHTIDDLYGLKSLYLAVNGDYWRWSSRVDKYFKDDSSIGASLYIVPSLERLSFPLRLEYIHQGESRIYLDSPDAEDVYAVTFTPTYNLTCNVFLRGELSYVHADNGFSDDKGRLQDDKYMFAVETGVKF